MGDEHVRNLAWNYDAYWTSSTKTHQLSIIIYHIFTCTYMTSIEHPLSIIYITYNIYMHIYIYICVLYTTYIILPSYPRIVQSYPSLIPVSQSPNTTTIIIIPIVLSRSYYYPTLIPYHYPFYIISVYLFYYIYIYTQHISSIHSYLMIALSILDIYR